MKSVCGCYCHADCNTAGYSFSTPALNWGSWESCVIHTSIRQLHRHYCNLTSSQTRAAACMCTYSLLQVHTRHAHKQDVDVQFFSSGLQHPEDSWLVRKYTDVLQCRNSLKCLCNLCTIYEKSQEKSLALLLCSGFFLSLACTELTQIPVSV